MKTAALLLSFVVLYPAIGFAQHDHTGYAEHEGRDIKALSPDEIEGYLNGAGMGMALPAELNGYPGPRHVLELAEQLELGDEQAAAVQKIYNRMHEQAVEIGTLIVELERRLDRAFAERSITPASLSSLTDEIAQHQGSLRAVHLKAHLETAEVLSMHQRHMYDRLRGYKR